MHESLEWLAGRTKSAFSNLSTSQMLSPAQESHVTMDLPPVSEQIMQTLSELAKSFQDMADRCLLVLHLEVRYDTAKPKTAIEMHSGSSITCFFLKTSPVTFDSYY